MVGTTADGIMGGSATLVGATVGGAAASVEAGSGITKFSKEKCCVPVGVSRAGMGVTLGKSGRDTSMAFGDNDFSPWVTGNRVFGE